jgi:hypothetical protein
MCDKEDNIMSYDYAGIKYPYMIENGLFMIATSNGTGFWPAPLSIKSKTLQ